jgi:hypothetical protein
MIERIKQCPFCGGCPVVINEPNNENLWNNWKISCHPKNHCSVSPCTEWFETKEKAGEAWNVRFETEQ